MSNSGFLRLHFPILLLLAVDQPLLGSAKRVLNRSLHIRRGPALLGVMRLMTDRNLLSRNTDGDMNLRYISVPVLLVKQFDGHATAHQVGMELFQSRHMLLNQRFNLWVWLSVVEGDFQRDIHSLPHGRT